MPRKTHFYDELEEKFSHSEEYDNSDKNDGNSRDASDDFMEVDTDSTDYSDF